MLKSYKQRMIAWSLVTAIQYEASLKFLALEDSTRHSLRFHAEHLSVQITLEHCKISKGFKISKCNLIVFT